MKTFRTMLKTELKLSLRGLDMFIFAICIPIIILVVLGVIYGNSPAYSGASYTFIEQSFGAIVTISISAGGIMGLPLVVSDYRSKHILKRFQVTPINPSLILSVQVTIYALYALLSFITLFIIGSLFFNLQLHGSLLYFILGWLLVIISMFSIGMMIGGVAKNSKTAGILASLLYFPMLIFSGATLPYEVMPSTMQKIVDILPLTQGIKILKSAMLGLPTENILLPICALIVIAIVCTLIALRFFKWE